MISLPLAASGPNIPNYGGIHGCASNNANDFCWGWVKSNWGGVLRPALVQHIELSLMAVAIGFAISFLLALAARRAGWVATPVTLVSSFLYTIPSLALFEILVPITHINWFTVEIALVSYTLLILFTNTLAGLSGISPEVRDAAAGIGLNSWQTTFRVELPLALPTIFAGIRVAMVTVISLATVAAYIMPTGLGAPIFDALGKDNFKTELIAAGALSILLALVADFLLVGLQRVLTPWARSRRAN